MPDLILLDWMLPRLSGLEVCRQLRGRGAKVPIIMLTALTTERDRVDGLDVGADDYVSKPFSVRELLARVRAQVRRDDWHANSGEEFSFGDVTVRPRQRLVLRKGKRIALSAREFELLRYLAAHRNEVVSREQLLRVRAGRALEARSERVGRVGERAALRRDASLAVLEAAFPDGGCLALHVGLLQRTRVLRVVR